MRLPQSDREERCVVYALTAIALVGSTIVALVAVLHG